MNERIAVLCGGDGAEREVSLRSGAAVTAALIEAGYRAEAVDLRAIEETRRALRGLFDAVFVAMHGSWGEDGQLEAQLEAMGVPYTGSDPNVCDLAMDKGRSCAALRAAGLTVPKGILLPKGAPNLEAVRAELGDAVVVKPCSGGSTVGITILQHVTADALRAAVDLARKEYGPAVLIEEYIGGRELTVAVWERDGSPEALPVIEIVPHTGFYDYRNKYTVGATEYLVPAPLAPAVAERVAGSAVAAHRALGCRDYSRADFRLSEDGTPWILEVNTAPGMTATSLVPKAARAAGLGFPEFVAHLVRSALRRGGRA